MSRQSLKHSLLCGAFALMLATPAFASAHAPDPVIPADPWTGLYGGVTMGDGFGSSSEIDDQGNHVGDVDTQGVVGGVTLGYNYQYGNYVFGFESDGSGSALRAGNECTGINYYCAVNQDWFATFRGRIGYSFGSYLPYLTSGLAVGTIHATRYQTASGIFPNDENQTEPGLAIGGGGEYMFPSTKWTAKIEYLYLQYADASITANSAPGSISYQVPFSANIVRIGFNYKF